MFKDGDDEDEHNMNVTRYPCMPSLVALQQMRNRLQMAHLGKKLMKWTALATGRELRRLAIEINETHRRFNEDMRTAFMLLARGRYFCSNLNQYVLENVEAKACVRVETTNKSISGVKVPHMEVVELGGPPYNHLGLEKGGHTIEEAKEKWRELLKKMILMVQQRTGFARIEVAHKNATKKWNILIKIVIPKLLDTIAYILIELEEQERENLFRIKVFKKSQAHQKESPVKVCCCCLKMFEADTQVESVCPACSKAAKLKKESNLKIEIAPCKSAEVKSNQNRKRLEQLMAHIDEVIGLTKNYKTEGIVSPSIEKFIKTCSKIKLKIENMTNAPPSCDICQKALEMTESRITLTPKPSTNNASTCNIQEPPESCKPCSVTSEPKNEDILGYFETEYKEIVKVRRLQNEDGSISEEKQVITVKTEKKCPNKLGALEDKEIFDTSKIGDTEYESRRSKSVHTNHNERLEPKIRRCMSSDQYGLTQTERNCKFSSASAKGSRASLPAASQASCVSTKSVDSNCCSKKPRTVCGGDSIQNVSLASQSCCKIIKKPIESKSSCVSVCGDDRKRNDKSNNRRATSTEALWRDQWTSMTDFETVPSKVMKNPSWNGKYSSLNTDDNLDDGNELKSNSCCIIKIIKKPNNESNKTGLNANRTDCKNVVIKGGMLEVLKKIILPNTNSSRGLQKTVDEPETEFFDKPTEVKICKSCSEKMNSLGASQKSFASSKSSKYCSADDQSMDRSCPSCGTMPKSSCTSISSKSLAACSLTSIDTSARNSCCNSQTTSKKSSEKKVDCKICTAEEAPSAQSVCCSNTKSTSTCCPLKSSEESLKKDASTSTRRSARFDVRPLRRRPASVKANLDCTCYSDSHMLRNRKNKQARRTKSFCEDEYYYFRW
ncbi:uncharacterized protein LOC114241851 [Bombyx mandarina]|uniref:Uncharacterized protein LOC114241851 n=1 Tax=Bombyx mandarina TaxID=7092 RepID=A0A6J2JH58_BOMMA|nr:uncharacterized protein LOC114241851 [Bombyx mandarina]